MGFRHQTSRYTAILFTFLQSVIYFFLLSFQKRNQNITKLSNFRKCYQLLIFSRWEYDSCYQLSQLSIHWKLQWTPQGNLAFSSYSYFISYILTINKTSYCQFFKVMTTKANQPTYLWLYPFWDKSSKEVQMKRVYNVFYSMKQNIRVCIYLLFKRGLSVKIL